MKKYIHKGLEWFVLKEFDNRTDAVNKKHEVKEMMNKGKIQKGTLDIVDRNINTKTKQGMRKGKFYLLGRPIN